MGLTIEDFLMAAPAWDTQLALTAIFALGWQLLLPFFAKKVVAPVLSSHPMVGQYKAMNKDGLKTACFVETDLDGALDLGSVFISIGMQHFIGGILTLPVVLGLGTSTAFALGRYGALCEVGWELQDTLSRTYQVLFGGEEGQKVNPVPLRIILGIHHTMGMSLVIPMNVYYPNNYYYIYLVFLLQFCASISLFFQHYGYLLDISSKRGLLKMKLSVGVVWVFMLYGRLVGYVYTIYKLLVTFWSTSLLFFSLGLVAAMAMSLLNVLFVLDATGKFSKFMRMKIEEPSGKGPRRRNSLAMHLEVQGNEPTTEMKLARRMSSVFVEAKQPSSSTEPLLQVQVQGA